MIERSIRQWCGLKSRTGSYGRTRLAVRPALDLLEERALMATDLAMLATTSIDPSTIQVRYSVSEAAVGQSPLVVVYRSADATLDPGDIPLGQTTLSNADLSVGEHTKTISLSSALEINPSRKFVLAALDAGGTIGETNETNNVGAFRKFTVAAVTHGYQADGVYPTWVTDTTNALIANGYDIAIPIDWAQASSYPANGLATLAAQGMTQAVTTALPALGLGPNDVVDIHLIGHSRGSGVVSQSANFLGGPTSASRPAASKAGLLKLTLLDPHPAANGPVPLYSASIGPLGRLSEKMYLSYQTAVNDPAINLPSYANIVEVFHQQTPALLAANLDERFINPWGDVPVNLASASYYEVSNVSRSHQNVDKIYLQSVVPTLINAGAVPFPRTPTPTPPVGGGGGLSMPIHRTQKGVLTEFQTFRAAGVPADVAISILAQYNTINALQENPAYQAQAVRHIDRLAVYIAKQAAHGRIAPPLAEKLIGTGILAKLLLFGIAPTATATAHAKR